MNCRTGSVVLPNLARNVLLEKCNHSVNHIFFFLSLLSEFLGMVRGSPQSTVKAISDSDRVDDVDWRLWRKFIDLMNFMLLQHWYRRINFSCKLGSQSWRKVKCCLSDVRAGLKPKDNYSKQVDDESCLLALIQNHETSKKFTGGLRKHCFSFPFYREIYRLRVMSNFGEKVEQWPRYTCRARRGGKRHLRSIENVVSRVFSESCVTCISPATLFFAEIRNNSGRS